jgi:hypothetical protein
MRPNAACTPSLLRSAGQAAVRPKENRKDQNGQKYLAEKNATRLRSAI